MLYRDRFEAILLAHRLRRYGVLRPLLLVARRETLALGKAVAEAMAGGLDVVLIQPLVSPGCVPLEPEPDETFRFGGTGWWWPRAFVRRQAAEPGRPASEIRDRVVILVDDGETEGATLGTVVDLLRRAAPRRLVAAFGTASDETLDQLSHRVDEVICLSTLSSDDTVSRFRQDYAALGEEDVALAFEAVRGCDGALAA
jgi:predicted phosphoribosyltransferase